METSFAIDDSGSTYLAGGNAVIPTDEQFILPLLGYLNSKLANWFLSQITPSFRANFQKFESQHLLNLPVLKDVFDNPVISSEISDLVTLILECKQNENITRQNIYEMEIDKILSDISGIDLEEIQ